jgi:hypothetical protein
MTGWTKEEMGEIFLLSAKGQTGSGAQLTI